MKTLNNMLFYFVGIFILTCCSDDLVTPKKVVEPETGQKPFSIAETAPFEAKFTGDYFSVKLDCHPDCADSFKCHAIVDFVGEGTHLGKFTGRFDFCACGPKGAYGPTTSYMVAANGDSLFVSCQGRVVKGRLDDHPDHVVSYWRDPFVILGGTGKFEGATGSGYTDDYNTSLDPNSHHHWKGSITLIKGKR